MIMVELSMVITMKTLMIVILSYLFGSIPWGLVIGKVFYHKDIREEGSGNLGGSNAGRVLGKEAGITVVVLDALKALFSMAFASIFGKEAIIFAGLACCIGHCFPIFAQFRGGKAVATTYGFFLGIAMFLTHHYFWQFFFPILCFFGILYLSKMVSLASIVSILICAIVSFILKVDLEISLSILLLWVFVTYRHKENIKRMLKGEENKVSWL